MDFLKELEKFEENEVRVIADKIGEMIKSGRINSLEDPKLTDELKKEFPYIDLELLTNLWSEIESILK
jgi:NurA-like 5'-3' nuclease